MVGFFIVLFQLQLAFARHLFHLRVIGVMGTATHRTRHPLLEQATEVFHILHLRQQISILQLVKTIEKRLFLLFSILFVGFFLLNLTQTSLLCRTKFRHFLVANRYLLPLRARFFQQTLALQTAQIRFIEFRFRKMRYRLLMSQIVRLQDRQFAFLVNDSSLHFIQLLLQMLFLTLLLLKTLFPLVEVLLLFIILSEFLRNGLIIVKHRAMHLQRLAFQVQGIEFCLQTCCFLLARLQVHLATILEFLSNLKLFVGFTILCV